jgi:L-malate glycosyltransferase
VKIGITCYPTFGGSGVVATELGEALAARGHEIHFIAYALPSRLELPKDHIRFHEVEAPSYPLFQTPPYTLALATKMADVALREALDLLHVHYALPHAISAILAREMLEPRRLAVVTTLHGTDITIVGQDRSYLPITRFGIERSDAVTAVSVYLRDVTIAQFDIGREIDVISNFVDVGRYRPDGASDWARHLARPPEKLLVHVSNFRPVKRIADVLEIFERVRRRMPARLLMVGDGPDRAAAEGICRERGFADAVTFLGNVAAVETLLPAAHLMLLPSDHESFGLAALEAMACGVPVIGTSSGGLPEVVIDGECGRLLEVGDVEGMGRAAIEILADESRRQTMGWNARRRAVEVFPAASIVDRYLALYQRVLSATQATAL